MRSGRIGIAHYRVSGSNISHNLVEDVSLQSNDIGFIYTWGTDGGGTEIAYNIGRRNLALFGNGIYFDDGSRNHVVHHNLIESVWGHGVFMKDPNDVYNNTVVGSGRQMVGTFPYDEPVDLSGARVINNVGPELLVDASLQTASETGSKTLLVSTDWQTITLPFDDLERPWYEESNQPLDLSAVAQLGFETAVSGEFTLWIDNVILIAAPGGSDLLIDDFDDGDNLADTDTYWWADGGSNCDGCYVSSAALEVEPSSGGYAAAVTVDHSLQGWNLLGLDISGFGGVTEYEALRFDVRLVGNVVLHAALGSPVYASNANCPLDSNSTVSDDCGIDQGQLIAPYTDGYVGAAPDLGAFESGNTAWEAGSDVDDVAAWAVCPEDLPEGTPEPSGEAGSGAAGEAGSGGTAQGGEAGAGLEPASAGSSGMAGARGGTTGSGGSNSGGMGGGMSGDGGRATGKPNQGKGHAGGCGCRTGAAGSPARSLGLAGLLALSLLVRRRDPRA